MCLCVGAVGDVDGDGSLDLVSIVSLSATVNDQFGHYLRSERRVKIAKYNLEFDMIHAKTGNFIKLDPSDKSNLTAKAFGHLRSVSLTPWAAYLGAHGDSVYHGN